METIKNPDGSMTLTVTWSFNGEYCLDCGLPAAFWAYRYGHGSAHDALCAICAANSAADDGAIIVRMFEKL